MGDWMIWVGNTVMPRWAVLVALLLVPAVIGLARMRLKESLTCAYCGALLGWRWRWWSGGHWHRFIEGPCQCETIGGHPKVGF
jgi:hypothetical protein